MSDHEDLADRLDDDAKRLEHESEQLAEQGESARTKIEQAQQDEFTPAPLGQHDPAHREAPEGEGEGADTSESQGMDPERLGEPPSGDEQA